MLTWKFLVCSLSGQLSGIYEGSSYGQTFKGVARRNFKESQLPPPLPSFSHPPKRGSGVLPRKLF